MPSEIVQAVIGEHQGTAGSETPTGWHKTGYPLCDVRTLLGLHHVASSFLLEFWLAEDSERWQVQGCQMVIFTQLPTRKSAQVGRLLVQDADLEPAPDIAIRELLSRVRLEFEKDDEKMASHLLHYRDIVVQESQSQELRVQFELPYETTEADEEQCRPNRRVYPPTPARPSMETLARLMDVSYTDWSQPSYEDTSADSKLAEWLASFAQDQRSSSLEDSIGKLMRKPSNTPEASTRKTSLFNNIQPAFGSPGQTPWRPHNRARSQNSSSGTRRRAVSDPVSPWYNQTSSSASSTSPSPVRHVRLQLSPIHIPDTVNAHRGSMQFTCSDEDKGVQAPVIPPFSFEVQAKALATEDISNHRECTRMKRNEKMVRSLCLHYSLAYDSKRCSSPNPNATGSIVSVCHAKSCTRAISELQQQPR